jgi:CRP-like cAMP-binding protein
MKTMETIISEHPFFQGLSPKHMELLAGCAKNVRFNADQFIVREGTESNEFFVLTKGKVALEILRPEKGPIRIQTIGEGDILGWSWLFSPYRRCFDARALELTRAICFDGECLRKKCDSDVELGYELVKRFSRIIGERLQAARMQLLDLYAPETEDKPR